MWFDTEIGYAKIVTVAAEDLCEWLRVLKFMEMLHPHFILENRKFGFKVWYT